MSRPEAPIRTVGPVAAFAQRLRDLRSASGLTYAKMAVTAQFAVGTLAAAARGQEMPTWELTRRYIEACGVDDSEIERWERDWKATVKAAKMLPPSRRLAAEEMPDPRRVTTYRELLDQLGILKIAAGDLPYRSFYFGTPNPNTRGPAPLPPSTISDLFTGKHVGRFEVFALVVQGLVKQAVSWYGEPRPENDLAWHDVAAWHLAWRRARTDLNRRQEAARTQMVDENQVSAAEFVSWMANDHPEAAAFVMGRLEPHHREQVLQALPLDVADAIHRAKPLMPVAA